MPQGSNPDVILERARALREKSLTLYAKALEKAELADRTRLRAARLLSEASATRKKTVYSPTPNQNGVRFLKIDLDVALNFTRMALHSHGNRDKRTRNQARARRAHDAITRLKNRLEISRHDALQIGPKLQKLRADLEQLGERF